MMNEPTPIKRSLAVSVAAHILIFGTALAFAHSGGVLFTLDRGVITVSLISEDKSGGVTGKVLQRVKELMAHPVRSSLADGDAMERAVSTSPDAAGQAREGAPRDSQDQGQAEEQGLGSRNGTGEGAVEGPVDASAGKLFGYSSAEWQLLQSSLERAKAYPRLARERGIEGTVLVRFRARPSGSIEQVDIVKSSGARILDEASISTVYRAAPIPYVDGWVEVPMVYQLRKAGEP
jgi:TonB family protein